MVSIYDVLLHFHNPQTSSNIVTLLFASIWSFWCLVLQLLFCFLYRISSSFHREYVPYYGVPSSYIWLIESSHINASSYDTNSFEWSSNANRNHCLVRIHLPDDRLPLLPCYTKFVEEVVISAVSFEFYWHRHLFIVPRHYERNKLKWRSWQGNRCFFFTLYIVSKFWKCWDFAKCHGISMIS